MSYDRIIRLTANPLAEPADLDRGFVAKVRAMLDAFVAAAPVNSQTFLHERHEPLAYAVVEWAVNRYPIEVSLTTANGRTYEGWAIRAEEATVHVFPRERMLYPLKNDLQSEIDRIRREADEQVKALLAATEAA